MHIFCHRNHVKFGRKRACHLCSLAKLTSEIELDSIEMSRLFLTRRCLVGVSALEDVRDQFVLTNTILR